MTESLCDRVAAAEAFLSRFHPLERVMSVDTFDSGQHGWAAYFPDYDGWEDYEGRYPYVEPLKQILDRTLGGTIADRVDRKFPIGPRAIPRLSATASSPATGSRATGSYALRVTTLSRAGAQAVAKKRLNSPWNARFRLETYFAFEPSAHSVRAISLSHDVHDPYRIRETGGEPRRWWPGVRYLCADAEGNPVGQWQALLRGSWGTMDGPWTLLDGGRQEVAATPPSDQLRWHYLRFTFDLSCYRYVDFRCDDKEIDVDGLTHVFDPPLEGWRASTDKAHGLVFPTFGIQANADTRCSLYLDSIVISASEE